MCWLKNREFVADVTGAAETESANHLSAKIGNDIAEQVGSNQHIIVVGILKQPHCDSIDVGIIHLDLRIVFSYFLRDIEEEAVSGSNNICLMDDGNFFAVILAGKLESGSDDLFRTFFRIDLTVDGVFFGTKSGKNIERFRVLCQHFSHFLRNRGELDTTVKVFSVLTENDEVDVFLVIERIAFVAFGGAEAGVKVEHLTHSNDR